MKKVLVIQGPNLNMLGKREPAIYGSDTLEDFNQRMEQAAYVHRLSLTFFQSNHEGEIIDRLHQAMGKYDGIIINPGAFTHYSYAIADAIAAISIPTIEVHISNIYKREAFRQHSVIAAVAIGQISGLGIYGYLAAISYFDAYFQK